MVSARVNELATAAYGLWMREDATLEEMRAGFDGMCPGPPVGATVTEGAVGGRAVLTTMAEGHLAGHDPADPRVSPFLAPLGGLPPLLVQVGSSEVLEDDAVRVVDGVLAAGGDATLQVGYEMVHVFQMFADRLPEAQRAVDRAGGFVRAHARATAAV
jgi:acetyl esterase/lipase